MDGETENRQSGCFSYSKWLHNSSAIEVTDEIYTV